MDVAQSARDRPALRLAPPSLRAGPRSSVSSAHLAHAPAGGGPTRARLVDPVPYYPACGRDPDRAFADRARGRLPGDDPHDLDHLTRERSPAICGACGRMGARLPWHSLLAAPEALVSAL